MKPIGELTRLELAALIAETLKQQGTNYYYFKDRQCLEQALLVARQHPINFQSLKAWHENEDQMSAYKDFVKRVKG